MSDAQTAAERVAWLEGRLGELNAQRQAAETDLAEMRLRSAKALIIGTFDKLAAKREAELVAQLLQLDGALALGEADIGRARAEAEAERKVEASRRLAAQREATAIALPGIAAHLDAALADMAALSLPYEERVALSNDIKAAIEAGIARLQAGRPELATAPDLEALARRYRPLPPRIRQGSRDRLTHTAAIFAKRNVRWRDAGNAEVGMFYIPAGTILLIPPVVAHAAALQGVVDVLDTPADVVRLTLLQTYVGEGVTYQKGWRGALPTDLAGELLRKKIAIPREALTDGELKEYRLTHKELHNPPKGSIDLGTFNTTDEKPAAAAA